MRPGDVQQCFDDVPAAFVVVDLARHGHAPSIALSGDTAAAVGTLSAGVGIWLQCNCIANGTAEEAPCLCARSSTAT
ncbi:hypothetical protein GCM10017581_052640 [Dactylosporangium matsuzakiense]|uniref:Uncharacterized protein n=1 Tax=Dactylosporangium matsuzakiense TaxID=53360 RepID=A0A9W6KL73_9ACTN|nr:hypothetical protein GCM10017581_052640 [Dactylosporangium matsuzakiense]